MSRVLEVASGKLDLNRLYKLFRRYEKQTIQGIKDGYLFFNTHEAVIAHASKMAAWHLQQEQAERQ